MNATAETLFQLLMLESELTQATWDRLWLGGHPPLGNPEYTRAYRRYQRALNRWLDAREHEHEHEHEHEQEREQRTEGRP